MKRYLLASTALVLGVAMAAPAMAEIDVHGTVTYTKDVDITETLTKVKGVVFVVSVVVAGTTAAEANAVTNQRIGPFGPVETGTGPNVSQYTAGSIFRAPADFYAVTLTSVIGNIGVTQFNQDVGVGSNQSNVLSAAVGANAFFAEANNATAQYITGESVFETGRTTTNNAAVADLRRANIDGSVNSNTGVVMVNQNAGVFNNQHNSAALAVGLAPGAVALAESDLGQWNTGNITVETNVARSANINNSGNGNTGIVAGNQGAGYMANQANMISISASFNAGTGGNAFATGFMSNITAGQF